MDRFSMVTLRELAPDRIVDIRSGGTGRYSIVEVDNRTAEKVELFWIDFEGNRKHYKSVESGTTLEQSTFEGHVWVVVKPDGTDVGVWIAERRPGRVILKP